MPPWQKLEIALRRANELLEVDKKQDALDTLHDVIKARKHRTWTKVHEQIMLKHLELCVELRKPRLAKDGLFQYRNVWQQVNVKSLEDVTAFFLEQSERKADEARQASQGLVEDVVDDLDQAESPERLLLSAVSDEGAQDRADRSVLSPWLRFLWESYRQCLELLRNNIHVEQLYHKVAKQAFQFCLKYQRRAEFRKLCDNLRTHLNQLKKTHHMHYAVKLNNPETLAMHQETRLTQLDVAIQMELWQEAYRSAEDVHQLMLMAKRSAKAKTLSSYYERLALVFWKAGNTLYHTAALFKLFQLHKDMKKSFTSEEATHLATRVLLAALSIRWSDHVNDLARHLGMAEAQTENQRRLASLLSWMSPPNRPFLLKEVQRLNVIGLAIQPAQQLFQWLECEFSPLKMAPEIQRLLEAVNAYGKVEYSQYVNALQQVAALKILKQISQVYRSISLQRLLSIVPFFDIFRLEKLIVAAGKKEQMQVRIDHIRGAVEFGVGEALTFSSAGDQSASVLSSQLDVPVIQTMPSEHIRQYLQQMYTVFQTAVETVDNGTAEMTLERLKYNAKYYEYHKLDQHTKTLQRKKCMEGYKEMLEKIKNEQEELTKMQERREMQKRQLEDQQRLLQEKRGRTKAQRRREQKEMTRRVMQDRIDRMKNPNFSRLIKDLPEEQIQNLDAETLLQKQITHMEQEKREQVAKMKRQEKKWDCYVQALHQEEILQEVEYKERDIRDRETWQRDELERVQWDEEEHMAKLSHHKRLVRVEEEALSYLKTVREARAAETKRRMEEWEKKLEETRQRRIQQRKHGRKEKRRQEWLEAKKLEKMKKTKRKEKGKKNAERRKRKNKAREEWEKKLEEECEKKLEEECEKKLEEELEKKLEEEEEWEKKLEVTRQRRLQQRKDKRREERRQEWLQPDVLEKINKRKSKKNTEKRKRKNKADEVGMTAAGIVDHSIKAIGKGHKRVVTMTLETRTVPMGSGWVYPMEKPSMDDSTRRFAGARPLGEGEDQWRRVGPPGPQGIGDEPLVDGEIGMEDSGRGYSAVRPPPPPMEEEHQWRRQGPPAPTGYEDERREHVPEETGYAGTTRAPAWSTEDHMRRGPPVEGPWQRTAPPEDSGPWKRSGLPGDSQLRRSGLLEDCPLHRSSGPAQNDSGPWRRPGPPEEGPLRRSGPPEDGGSAWRRPGPPENDSGPWRHPGPPEEGSGAWRRPYPPVPPEDTGAWRRRGPESPPGTEDKWKRPRDEDWRRPGPPLGSAGYGEDRRSFGGQPGADCRRYSSVGPPQDHGEGEGMWRRPRQADGEGGAFGGGGRLPFPDSRRGGPDAPQWGRVGPTGSDSNQWRKT